MTSLLRRRFGYRAWRITHWAAYACWPVALLHGLGTGSDTKRGWMLVVIGGCVIVVIVAVVARATAGWPEHPQARLAALAGSALVPLGLLVWLPSGPLAAGWAQQAGTPVSLLRPASTATTTGTSSTSTATPSFTTHATGTVRQTASGDGLSHVNISLGLAGQKLSQLGITLFGQALDNGGLEMTSSNVTLGPSAQPREYHGSVTALAGTNITARVADASGHRLTLRVRLQISAGSGSATGTVSATP